MQLFLKNGREVTVGFEPSDLWILYGAMRRGHAHVAVKVIPSGEFLNLNLCDPDKTFGDLIVGAYPSTPPPDG